MCVVFLDLHVFAADNDNATIWAVSDVGWQRIEVSNKPGTFSGTGAVTLAESLAEMYGKTQAESWDRARIFVHDDRHLKGGYSYCLGESSALMRDIQGARFLHSYAGDDRTVTA